MYTLEENKEFVLKNSDKLSIQQMAIIRQTSTKEIRRIYDMVYRTDRKCVPDNLAVVCVETGEEFESIRKLSEHLNLTWQYIKYSLDIGRAYKGKHYRYK